MRATGVSLLLRSGGENLTWIESHYSGFRIFMMDKYCYDDLPAAQKRLVAWPYRDGSEVCGSAPFAMNSGYRKPVLRKSPFDAHVTRVTFLMRAHG